MGKWQFTTEPVITDALLCNPGIGFIAAPQLEGEKEQKLFIQHFKMFTYQDMHAKKNKN